ncbi:MAG: threonine ammonia-lyase, biosynthetic, partial [Mariprofundaceae bacterium]|nr:threonine ammonia-lyase, biosynthetic [Mariprofundaceae bacterium]
VEPAGALAVAGMKKYVRQHDVRSQSIACINSGANMNFDRLRHVAERSEIGERREALFAVTISEEAGSFLRFCKLLGDRSITEFNYRLSSREQAHVFVGIAVNSEQERLDILHTLQQHQPVIDLMENEAAKLHLRHIVGGKSIHIQDEKLYRFEFPERPSALLDFLIHIAGRWNISLFHYRNHGAAFGRVLVGVEVPKYDEQAFQGFILTLGYNWVDESNNEALQLFL